MSLATMNPKIVNPSKVWKKLSQFIVSEEARAIWHPEMMDYRILRQFDCIKHFGPDKHPLSWLSIRYDYATTPSEFDSTDWRPLGREPAYYAYTCHGACHWLVNLNLACAQHVYPKKQWRIVSSNLHSTVVDSEFELLFDMNAAALKSPAWQMAANPNENPQSFAIGERLPREFSDVRELSQKLEAGKLTQAQALDIFNCIYQDAGSAT